MRAHFIGGPLNGTDRILEEGQQKVTVYELQYPPQVERFAARAEGKLPPILEHHEYRGEYHRTYPQQPINDGPALPAIFVWMDERPFTFAVQIDAVPGASRELAKRVLSECVARLEHHGEAFPAGIIGGKVLD